MGKLNLVVEDAPVKVTKNEDSYKEVAEAFNALPIGKAVKVANSEVSSLSLIGNIKKYITLKEGEDIRISRLYEDASDAKKLSGVRLIKTIYKARKPKEAKVKSQGEVQTSQTNS